MQTCGRNTIVVLAALLAIMLSPLATSAAQTTGGVASASSYNSAKNDYPSRAFDGTLTDGWASDISSGMPQWLGYEFESPKVVTNYTIICSSKQDAGWWVWENWWIPKTWTFEGSNEVSQTWDVLDTISDGGIVTDDTGKSFPVANTTSYRKYRINVATNNNNNAYSGERQDFIYVTELELDGTTPRPVISNSLPESVTATSAALVGNLVSTGDAPTRVYCFWGITNGGTDKGNWATNDNLGPMVPGFVTNSVSGLSSSTRYYYAFYASNSISDGWASPSVNFSTLGAPVVRNDGGADQIEIFSARLRGEILGGNPAPDTYVCWGDNDPGVDSTGAWDTVVSMGPQSDNFNQTVSELTRAKQYFYRCYATNTYGGAWAPAATNFVTAAIGSVQGGNSTNDVGGYRIHIFTNSAIASNFVVKGDGIAIEVLVVAGGGGGGRGVSGAGGAGGLIYTNGFTAYPGTYAVVVGDGGVGCPSGLNADTPGTVGASGSNSSFGSLIAAGGGGGSCWYPRLDATAGGSGGGGYAGGNGAEATPAGQGHAGGNGGVQNYNYTGGGGGGAGSAGSNGTATVAGDGGSGLYFSRFDTLGGAPAGWFAGGGGGGAYQGGTAGNGGQGGGGNAGAGGTRDPGLPGLANTGGGGGAGSYMEPGPYGGGGKGGSGIVMISYKLKLPPTGTIVRFW